MSHKAYLQSIELECVAALASAKPNADKALTSATLQQTRQLIKEGHKKR